MRPARSDRSDPYGRLGPVAPVTILITFGERNAIMTTGWYMAADPVLVENTKAWLAKAAKDLRRVEQLISAEEPDYEDAVFHCQQTVEKALKAFLTWHDQPFRKTHDIDALGRQCTPIDPTLDALVDRADRLTEYAWLYRYPGDADGPTVGDVEESCKVTSEVLRAIPDRLPVEVRP